MKAVSYFTGLFIVLLLIFMAGCKKEEPLPPPPDNPCPGVPTVEWMGQTYKTIQIGDQCWMRENLNVGEMILGDQDMTDNGVIEKYCYDNDPANCETYGGLYQWDEMMQYISDSAVQGICPDGWHIPTVTDWNELTDHLGGKWPAGDKLRDQGDTYWSTGHEDATNESGFTALPGGRRFSEPQGYIFDWLGNGGFFWSSSSRDNGIGYSYYLKGSGGFLPSYYGNRKATGNSIRCIKD